MTFILLPSPASHCTTSSFLTLPLLFPACRTVLASVIRCSRRHDSVKDSTRGMPEVPITAQCFQFLGNIVVVVGARGYLATHHDSSLDEEDNDCDVGLQRQLRILLQPANSRTARVDGVLPRRGVVRHCRATCSFRTRLCPSWKCLCMVRLAAARRRGCIASSRAGMRVESPNHSPYGCIPEQQTPDLGSFSSA
ncbi:hypothetical protein Micbo1qcDRAFT_46993 [Microdochium bolleyi]|uniref:Uncharacterized protein n=1 Tax=Microdochium bolleyi TaxID=196109 RepID=A0A136JCM8_9PEZI|nr:hypothetical protein Micbo1qcDRAFT_46993 [Microdochium bolleyi]